MPESEKFSPAGIWRLKVSKSEVTSPDQAVDAVALNPAKAERERMKTRFRSDASRCPSYTAGGGHQREEVGVARAAADGEFVRHMMFSSRPRVSGSVVSSHQASAPILKSALSIRFQ